MLGYARNAISAYQKVGVEAAVEVADPHRLVVLLFEGALAAIGAARAAIQQNNIRVKGESISKAIDIISNGLKASLDAEKGGDLAARLESLYDYMVLRLLQANMKSDDKALEEVSGLIGELLSAWREISPAKVAAA